ncbi:FAD-dependent oxidoreductase [Actinophytocola sp.]|uniref:FAD-dependent oxidoreductase n=1 Tax=Actinophytocola sp. TaxID=1872138 RepID=UPI00389B1E9C
MSSSSRAEVAVVGAGLSGLCLAQRLRRAGIDVRVYERDPGPFVRRQGYRITVDADGLRALRESLPPELYELVLATGGDPGGTFRFTNSRLRDAFVLTFKATPDGGRQIDRQVLRAILSVGLEDRVHYGRAAATVEPDGRAGLVLGFTDGTTTPASVVVGADGIGSAVRPRIMPGAEPVDTGMSGIYGRTPLTPGLVPAALLGSGVLAIGDEPGRAFFFTAMRFGEPPEKAFERCVPGHPVPPGGDYVMWGLVLRTSEAAGTDPRDLAAGFHPLVTRLVEAADDGATITSRFAVGRRPTGWPLPRATMMGDAAHAMPPFGAHGGNTALRDAAALGGKLVDAHRNGGSVESAILAYQNEMVPYAFRSVDSAAGMMRRLTASGRCQRWVLTRVLPRLHRVTVPETP